MKIILTAGTRPNFIKIAPLIRALKSPSCLNKITWKIVHTGQHYDHEMSQAFFDDLEITQPDYFLGAGSASHAVQTARIMTSFENVCMQERPAMIVVVGDVNSTLACSIVAKKLLIKVAHVEAGLRSGDMSMPEEINRIVTDAISDYFFATEQSAVDNLLREGKSRKKVFFVGNVMVDNLLHQVRKLAGSDIKKKPLYSLKSRFGKYVFLTLHRPSNVDDRSAFRRIAGALNDIAHETPIIFSVHPRTRKKMGEFGISLGKNVHLLPPLNFTDSLFLWKDASLVMTDSGGLQEETTALGVPCLTLRENTERPITVELGTNTLVGNGKDAIIKYAEKILKKGAVGRNIPPKWDGKAAQRIVKILCNKLDEK